MSDCLNAPKRNRHDKAPRAVKFNIRNPEALLRPEVARAVVELIRAPNHQQEPEQAAQAG